MNLCKDCKWAKFENDEVEPVGADVCMANKIIEPVRGGESYATCADARRNETQCGAAGIRFVVKD